MKLSNHALYILAGVLALAALGMVFHGGSDEGESGLQLDIPDDKLSLPESDKPLTRAELEQLLQEARVDYRQFIRAGQAGHEARRSLFFKRARAKLQTFMDQANRRELSGSDEEQLVRQGVEMLSDLNKQAMTRD